MTDSETKLLTSAASQIRHQGVSTVAAALVATLRVCAESLTAAVLNGTLVNVWEAEKHSIMYTAGIQLSQKEHIWNENSHFCVQYAPIQSSLFSVDLYPVSQAHW